MRRLAARIRARFERVPGAARSHPVRNGLIVLVLLGLVLFSGYTRSLPFGGEEGFLVRAEFERANEVKERSEVRVRGVKVGTVERLEADPDRDAALVTMRITDEDVEPSRDASAEARWRTLLGGTRYIELDPGSPGAAPLRDAVIPKSRTSSQVEFDDLNQVLDGETARAQQIMLREFARAFESPDRAAGRALEALSPATATIERGLRPLRGRESADLRRLVESTGRTLRALSEDDEELGALVDAAATTLRATTVERERLGELIEESPATLRDTQLTMRKLDGTLRRLDPLVEELRPGARRLAGAVRAASPALDEADALLRAAKPLLRDLDPTFVDLARAGRAGVPLFRGLDPTLRRLDEVIIPFLGRRDPDTGLRNYEAIGPVAAATSSAASEFDAEGYWFHFQAPGDERFVVTSPCQSRISDPSADEKVRCDALEAVLEQLFGGGS